MAYQGLGAVEFGHIAAEEEASALQRYFVETKEFSDVVSDRGKLLVIGRKGSGKSAIYVAIRDVDFQERAVQERPPEQEQLVRLRQILDSLFNEAELRTLCFDLGVDYDALPGEEKASKARELIAYLNRRGLVPDLVEVIMGRRPNIPLDDLLKEQSASLEYQVPFSKGSPVQISNIMTKYFSEVDLKDICLELGVDYENLLGERHRDKVRELVLYARRRGLISELIEAMRLYRPDISLDEVERTERVPAPVPPPGQPSALPYIDRDTVVEALTLQEYPWEVHKQVRDAGLPAEQAYVGSWKYIIWVLLAKRILSFDEPARLKFVDPLFWQRNFNPNVRYLHRFLRQNYGTIAPSFVELIADRTRTIRSLKVKDFEVGAEAEDDPSRRLVNSINFLNRALRSRVLAVLPSDKRFFVLFDQLDLGWDASDQTKQLLIGLILAARDVVRAAEKAGKQVQVVVFLRSDIHESLRFEDKNKLSPSVVELNWDAHRLKQLVSKRIEASAGGRWEDVFTGQPISGKSQLAYIVERTMLRPRDMIQFCVCARDAALRLGRDSIDNDSIREACRPYSDYMRKEIQDECKASEVEVNGLLAVLQEIGQERFNERQFRKACRSQGMSDRDAALRQIIDLSVVGVCRPSAKVMFRYQANPWDRLESTEELVVHPSLKYALGLAGPDKT
jgi:hypothetical protein